MTIYYDDCNNHMYVSYPSFQEVLEVVVAFREGASPYPSFLEAYQGEASDLQGSMIHTISASEKV